jgi:CheY-like chemotaxis protein
MKKCLIVDDVEVTRFTSEQIIRALGLDSQSAETAEEAIAAVQKESFDVLLLDWHLRHRSGLDVLKAARAARCAGAKIILFSGIEGAEKETEARTSGADAFLEKPTTKDKLKTCLEKLGIL